MPNWFTDAFTKSPAARYAETHEATLAKTNAALAQRGLLNICHECSLGFARNLKACQRCEWSATGPRKTQLVKVYGGNEPEKAFSEDANTLAPLGWRVASQSQGGVNTWQIGRKHSVSMTVIFSRD